MLSFFNLINQKRKITFSILFFFVLIAIFLPSVTGACSALDWDGCGEKIIVWLSDLLRVVASTFFWISSMVFDNLLHIGLSTNLFEQDFIKTAWSNIRDIANIGFILGMIYIAFSMMIDRGKWHKSLINLVIVIFAINFSLFFARVIVDAGNITAHIFLSSVGTTISEKPGDDYFYFARTVNQDSNDVKYKSVGAALVNGLRPEELLGIKNFQSWQNDISTEERKITGYLAMNLILSIIYFMIAKKFFKAGFMFLGRLVWIVFYMVSAPFYFITLFIPKLEGRIITDWLVPLLKKSFCIVVYLFFIWLIYIILNSGVNNIDNKNGDFLAVLAIFAIKGIFISVLLDKAEKIGSSMCENGNSTLGNIKTTLNSVTSGAGKVMKYTPIGGISRNITGVIGTKIKDSGSRLREESGVAGWVGDKLYGGGRSIMDREVAGKSYAADQNARMSLMKDAENEMKPEALRRRKINRLGVSDGSGNMDLNSVESFVDPKDQEKFEEAKFWESYDPSIAGQQLTEEQQGWKDKKSEQDDKDRADGVDVKTQEEHKDSIEKDLKEKSPDNVVFKEGIEKKGNMMSILSPQWMAAKNRTEEDTETKKEVQRLEAEKEKEQKALKQETQKASDKSDIVSGDISDVVGEMKNLNSNIEAKLDKIGNFIPKEKNELIGISESINSLAEINEKEMKMKKLSSLQNSDPKNFSIEEKKLITDSFRDAADSGILTEAERNTFMNDFNNNNDIDKAQLKNVVDGNESQLQSDRIAKGLVGVDKKDLIKDADNVMKNYKARINKSISTDESYQKEIFRSKINTIDKKISGIKASQEKADVRNKTVAESVSVAQRS